MTFILFCFCVWAAFRLSKLGDRLEALEKELPGIKARLAGRAGEDEEEEPEAARPAPEPRPEAAAPMMAAETRPDEGPDGPGRTGINRPLEEEEAPEPEDAAAAATVAAAEAPGPGPQHSPIDWERFAGVNLFAWAGGFALFLGAAFFVKYSFDHGLVSPLVRVTLSFLLGGGCVAGGLYLRRREQYTVTAQTLAAAGIAMLYAAVFAAGSIYHFISPGTAFVMMSLVTASSFLLAVRLDAKYVALLGLIGGFLTPPLLSTGEDRPGTLFTYILLLDAGVAATVLRTGWTMLLPLCLAGTGLMEFSWFAGRFDAGRAGTGAAIASVFAVFAAVFLELARRRSLPGGKVTAPCGLFLFFSTGLATYMLDIGDLGSRPALPFAVLLGVNALAAWRAYADEDFTFWQGWASALAFITLSWWTLDKLRPELLGHAFAAYLVFAALNAALPLAAWKLRGEKRGELFFAGLYPLLGLALVMLAMLRQESVTFFFWPVVLLLDALAVAGGLLVSLLWVPAAALAFTLAGGLIWLSKISQPAALGGFLAVFGAFALGFLALAVYLLRRAKTAAETAENLEAARWLPYLAAAAPYLLVFLAALKLRPDDPGMLFGFALLLSGVLLAVARLYDMGPLTLPALAGSFLLAAAWHASAFAPERAAGPLAWYAAFFALFAAFPAAFRERFARCKTAWAASAAAGPLFFMPVYAAVSDAMGKELIGLLPAVFAALYFGLLFFVLRNPESDEAAQNYKLSLTGGVTLFFVTLIFPVQFDKQWLTLGWALEGAALVWLFTRVPHAGLKKWGFCLLAIAFLRLTFNTAVFSYHPRQELPILNWYLYAYLTAAAALFAAARWWRPEEEGLEGAPVRGLLAGAATALLFLLLNIEIADYFSAGATLTFQFSGNVARDMTYTLGWSLFGAVLFVTGLRRELPAARKAAVGIFALALAKLFLHDVWSLSQLYRVAAFIVTAVILIAVSFLYQKKLAASREKI